MLTVATGPLVPCQIDALKCSCAIEVGNDSQAISQVIGNIQSIAVRADCKSGGIDWRLFHVVAS